MPTTGFPPLPALVPGVDAPRRVGVEVEFAGLAPDDAADLARASVGGAVAQVSAAEFRVEGSAVGVLKIYLDTAFRPEGVDKASEAGVEIARQVIPVEIVTEPLPQEDLPRIDGLVAALARAGAEGSRAHLLHGFGLHLNVALADPDTGADMPAVARAFALLEPWLRARDPLDLSRRVLPFTAPFPRAFADALAAAPGLDVPGLFDLIAGHISSRNHGLDLLPAYAHLAPDRFARHPAADGAVSPRPAYHFRMPESRIDEAAWALGYEWRRWWLVERVAADPDLLARLAELRAGPGRAWFRPESQAVLDAVTATLGPLAALAPEGGPASEAAR
ncbi:MAG: hypothetical protein GVY27_03640 [Deinococcus-Thermus bacterium]|nr:hypothetical protein [Deinococcota bacterium]